MEEKKGRYGTGGMMKIGECLTIFPKYSHIFLAMHVHTHTHTSIPVFFSLKYTVCKPHPRMPGEKERGYLFILMGSGDGVALRSISSSLKGVDKS